MKTVIVWQNGHKWDTLDEIPVGSKIHEFCDILVDGRVETGVTVTTLTEDMEIFQIAAASTYYIER